MVTIEERAKEYAPDPFLAALERKAYIAGATEQKAIDKAVAFLVDNRFFEHKASRCAKAFRKAMEEDNGED